MLQVSRLSGRFWIPALLIVVGLAGSAPSRAGVTREEVERAIHDGVNYLKKQQRADGSWPDVEGEARSGTTSLVTLALLTAGEKPNGPTISKALALLRQLGPADLRSTYAIGLQTMVFAAAEPERDQLRIAANVEWLERAQIRPAIRSSGPDRGATPIINAARTATTPTPSTPCWGCTRPARWACP